MTASQVETWDKRLSLVSETLDEWLTVQVRKTQYRSESAKNSAASFT
jgi:hypothetical protein